MLFISFTHDIKRADTGMNEAEYIERLPDEHVSAEERDQTGALP